MTNMKALQEAKTKPIFMAELVYFRPFHMFSISTLTTMTPCSKA